MKAWSYSPPTCIWGSSVSIPPFLPLCSTWGEELECYVCGDVTELKNVSLRELSLLFTSHPSTCLTNLNQTNLIFQISQIPPPHRTITSCSRDKNTTAQLQGGKTLVAGGAQSKIPPAQLLLCPWPAAGAQGERWEQNKQPQLRAAVSGTDQALAVLQRLPELPSPNCHLFLEPTDSSYTDTHLWQLQHSVMGIKNVLSFAPKFQLMSPNFVVMKNAQ